MRVQCTRTKQLRTPLTTTLGHPKSSAISTPGSFNYKSDYNNYSFKSIPALVHTKVIKGFVQVYKCKQ